VRLWRYAPTSELLHREDRDQADEAITLPVAFSDAKQILVVLVQGYNLIDFVRPLSLPRHPHTQPARENAVYLYKLVGGNQLKQEHVLPLCSAPYDAALDGEGNLWVTTFGGLEIFASSEGDTFSPVEEGSVFFCLLLFIIDIGRGVVCLPVLVLLSLNSTKTTQVMPSV